MAIVRIRARAEPMSSRSLAATRPVILAPSDAGRLLRDELRRYADGEIRGRSFLIAGHRGAGKTTTVEAQLREIARAGDALMRLLPVYLNGPALLEQDVTPTAATGTPVTGSRPEGCPWATVQGKPPAPAPQGPRLVDLVLQKVVLGLYQAVGREFSARIGQRARPKESTARELDELAARFEIELFESLGPGRLQDFWVRLGAEESGVLFDEVPPGVGERAQGLREIVALYRLNEAYMRIAGKLSDSYESTTGHGQSSELGFGADAKTGELLKPLAALATGATVTAASAVHGSNLNALLLGLASAVAATMFLKIGYSNKRSSDHKRGRTWMPDTSAGTLDRVVPTLIDKLKSAGLAPVFVIDELDKVDDLWSLLQPVVTQFKKLFTESSFTCLLVDRRHYEDLLLREHGEERGRHFSYFSHRVLVGIEPAQLRAYLTELFEIVEAKGGEVGAAGQGMTAVDVETLKWALLHRAELNPLALNRLVEGYRGADNTLTVDPRVIRTQSYRLHLTLQFMIELELGEPIVKAWREQWPELQPTLIDAAYYVSRRWRRQGEEAEAALDLSDTGRQRFVDYLDVCAGARGNGEARAAKLWDERQGDFLYGIARNIATKIATPAQQAARFKDKWLELDPRWDEARQRVLETLWLDKPDGVTFGLLQADAEPHRYRWAYDPVGRMLVEPAPMMEAFAGPSAAASTAPRHLRAIETIDGIERRLWPVLAADGEGSHPDGRVFAFLATLNLLPATPGWPQVARALRNLRDARGDADASSSAQEDEATLVQFADVLSTPESVRSICRTLICGGALGGFASRETVDEAVKQGATVLSGGLAFGRASLAEIDQSLGFLAAEFVDAFVDATFPDLRGDSVPEGLESVAAWAVADALRERCAAAFRLGADLLRAPGPDHFAREAWELLRIRLQQFETGRVLLADRRELLCAAAALGPYASIGLDLERVTLGQWTACVASREVRNEHPWLTGYALYRLGFQALGEVWQRFFWTRFGDGGVDADQLRGIDVLKESGSGDTLALVITKAKGGWAERWTQRPGRGMVWVATVAEADKLCEFIGKGGPAAGTLLVTWESGAAEPSDEERLRELLDQSKLGSSLREQFLYRSRELPSRMPAIIEPGSPDALFDRPA